jgi:hypothetical protein
VDEAGTVVGKLGGNVASYVCTPDGRVVHAIAGNVSADTLLAELEWATRTYERALAAAGDDPSALAADLGQRHLERASALQLNQPGVVITHLSQGNLNFDPNLAIYTEHEDELLNPFITEGLVVIELGMAGQGDVLLQTVHAYLGQRPLASLDEVAPYVWQQLLGEVLSDAPVTDAHIELLECRQLDYYHHDPLELEWPDLQVLELADIVPCR